MAQIISVYDSDSKSLRVAIDGKEIMNVNCVTMEKYNKNDAYCIVSTLEEDVDMIKTTRYSVAGIEETTERNIDGTKLAEALGFEVK